MPILSNHIRINIHYQVVQFIYSGGFGEIYEVYDERDARIKVLKILNPTNSKGPKEIAHFQQEAFILAGLKHAGIPSIDREKDGYFTWKLPKQSDLLHCLVMEKVDGIDLRKEMEQRSHQPLLQETALHWMEQLTQIIKVIHEKQFFHRDIKPENIMIRNKTNEIVLVDFGVARAVSETYTEKQKNGRRITDVGTYGYMAPEVAQGKGCPQSDFFSLGRTFVFLTTGKDIYDFKLNETDQLDWRSHAIYISDAVKDLIDRLMAPDPQDRPANAQILLEEIDRCRCQEQSTPILISSDSIELHKIVTNRAAKLLRRVGLSLLTGVIGSTLIVVGVRSQNWLQPMELSIFDQMMHWRPTQAERDKHILLIENTEADVDQYENELRSRSSFSEEKLLNLLDILEQSKAAVIGLDIYWDYSTKNKQLKQKLGTLSNLYGVCEIANPKEKGFAKPEDIPEVGFTNILEDSGKQDVRRQLLVRDAPAGGCQEMNSFALRIALEYLNQRNVPKLSNETCDAWVLKQTVLSFLKPLTGFYQRPDGGCQILLNPRIGRSPKQNFEVVSLSQVLSNQVPKERMEGKIVLIGTTANFGDTGWTLPGQSNEEMTGFFVQAEMVSYLVGLGFGERTALHFWALWQDTLWIAAWALLGSIIALRLRSRLPLFIAASVAILILGIIGQLMLQIGILVAIVPAAFAGAISGGASRFLYHKLVQPAPVKQSSSRLLL